MFRAPAMLLPHESTVAHEQRFIMDEPMISRSRLRQGSTIDENPHYQPQDELLQITQNTLSSGQVSNQCREFILNFFANFSIFVWFAFIQSDKGSVPHTRPVTPRSVTHNHDEDFNSDEESDPNNKSDEDRFNHSSSDEK